MLNIFDEATATMRRAVKEQTDQMLVEIKSATDQLNKAQVEFEHEGNLISKDRAALEESLRQDRAAIDDKERRNETALNQRERASRDKLMAVLSNNQTVLMAVQMQVDDGKMFTGKGERTSSHSGTERRDSMPVAPREKLEKGNG